MARDEGGLAVNVVCLAGYYQYPGFSSGREGSLPQLV